MIATSTDMSLRGAQAALARGDFAYAQKLCESLVAGNPRDTAARYCLGLALALSGRSDAAIDQWRRVLQQKPRDFPTLVNLAVALSQREKHAEAIPLFRSAIGVDASIATVHFNLGNSLLAVGDLDDAIVSLRAALTCDPRLTPAHNSLGVAHRRRGRPTEAIDAFQAALAIDQRCIEALGNLGVTLLERGQPEQAIAPLQRALQLEPSYAEAAVALAQAMHPLGRHDEALTILRAAEIAAPASVEIHEALCNALLRQRHFADALEVAERGLTQQPNRLPLWRARSLAFEGLQRFDEALSTLRHVLELAPDDTTTLSAAISCGVRCCDWELAASCVERLRSAPSGLSALHPFVALSVCEDPADQLQVAVAHWPARPSTGGCAANSQSLRPSTRIRIAYLSSDLREHAVAHLLIGVLEHHLRSRFEVHAVSLQSPVTDGEVNARIRSAVDGYHDIGADNDAAAGERLRALNLDIAVDLNGYTIGARPAIFAERIAAVQVGYLGYAGTTGSTAVDYLIADDIVVPAEEECWYSERVVRLPQCYLPNDGRRPITVAPGRAQAGLPESGLVFCAFTQAYKINRPLFDVWMRLLAAVPGSVLWLRRMGETAERNLLAAAGRHGIADERLVFAPHVASMAEHLGRQALADLYLDTTPYTAHSSACDALWAGLPVLSCAGRSFAGRVAASALISIGLPELVTHTLTAYEHRALELAHDATQLRALRERLAHNRLGSPLFDTARYTRTLESAFEQMYAHAQRGAAAIAFSVAAS